MLTVQYGPAAGAMALVALMGALGTTVGLSGAGWAVGITCGVGLNTAVARGLARYGRALGPADLVTLIRATFACGVAALVADALLHEPALRPLLALTGAALVLDAVDGLVARRTRTASAFGARFDGEADAFLILVLSVYVASTVGGWVVAIGTTRYGFAAAGWALPWLRGQLPPRYWRKVVAAAQGIVLAFAAAGFLPRPLTQAALGVALVLLAESFGRDVLWLWRHRRTGFVRSADSAAGLHDSLAEQDLTLAEREQAPGSGCIPDAAATAATTAPAPLRGWSALLASTHSPRMTSAFLRGLVERPFVADLVLAHGTRPTAAAVFRVLVGALAAVETGDSRPRRPRPCLPRRGRTLRAAPARTRAQAQRHGRQLL